MTETGTIGVAGAGAWGMALANAAAAAGRDVVLWGRNAERMRRFEATRVSDRLPGVRLAAPVTATSDVSRLAPSAAILIAVPAQATRDAAARLAALPGACAAGDLRQGHRAGHSRVHDRSPH